MNGESTATLRRHPLEDLLRQRLIGTAFVGELRLLQGGEGLILEGRTNTFYAKQIAQHLASQLTGLCVAANRIEVE